MLQWLISFVVSFLKLPGKVRMHFKGPTFIWPLVITLTGIDTVSSGGYAPGVSLESGGYAAPILELMLIVVIALAGYVYMSIANVSFKGQGSLALYNEMVKGWGGQVMNLLILSFTFISIVCTLMVSATDAGIHAETHPLIAPYLPVTFLGISTHLVVTTILILGVAGLLMSGVEKAIVVTVLIVLLYVGANVVVTWAGVLEVIRHPEYITLWQHNLQSSYHNDIFAMLGTAVKKMPDSVLGLTGLETAIFMIPFITGLATDDENHPLGKIKFGRKLIATVCIVISIFLLLTTTLATLVVPLKEALPGGAAHDHVLSYMSHKYVNESFGTIYDIITIVILSFAGVSALASALKAVPLYIPKQGMGPKSLADHRILIIVITVISLLLTYMFKGDVKAEGVPYGTTVVALLFSAALVMSIYGVRKLIATRSYKETIGKKERKEKNYWIKCLIISITAAIVLGYCVVMLSLVNASGIIISLITFAVLVIGGFFFRFRRSTELRCGVVHLDQEADKAIKEAIKFNKEQKQKHNVPNGTYPAITVNLADGEGENAEKEAEYEARFNKISSFHSIPLDRFAHLFLIVEVPSASKFEEDEVKVTCSQYGQNYVLRCQGTAIPNTLYCVLSYIRQCYYCRVDANFAFSTGDPRWHNLRFNLFGDGNIPVMTWNIARKHAKLEDINENLPPLVLHTSGDPTV